MQSLIYLHEKPARGIQRKSSIPCPTMGNKTRFCRISSSRNRIPHLILFDLKRKPNKMGGLCRGRHRITLGDASKNTFDIRWYGYIYSGFRSGHKESVALSYHPSAHYPRLSASTQSNSSASVRFHCSARIPTCLSVIETSGAKRSCATRRPETPRYAA